jgi:hypothetical protein
MTADFSSFSEKSRAVVNEISTESQLNIVARVSTFYLNKATEAHSMSSSFTYHPIKMECQFGGDPIMRNLFFQDLTLCEEDNSLTLSNPNFSANRILPSSYLFCAVKSLVDYL